jgi:hypothetical protein
MTMRKRTSSLRRKSGVTSIAELGPALWIVFVMITFPLLSFGTLGLRYAFLVNGVRYAAMTASQSKSFKTNFTDSNGILRVSAINTASSLTSQVSAYWHGVTISSTTTSIVSCAGGSTTTSSTTSPLAAVAANTVYNCQVMVVATLDPLFPQPGLDNVFGGVMACPGLTKPIPITCASQCMFEYPAGLTK